MYTCTVSPVTVDMTPITPLHTGHFVPSIPPAHISLRHLKNHLVIGLTDIIYLYCAITYKPILYHYLQTYTVPLPTNLYYAITYKPILCHYLQTYTVPLPTNLCYAITYKPILCHYLQTYTVPLSTNLYCTITYKPILYHYLQTYTVPSLTYPQYTVSFTLFITKTTSLNSHRSGQYIIISAANKQSCKQLPRDAQRLPIPRSLY